MHGNFGGKRSDIERNRTSDEARAVLGERGHVRESGRGARADSRHIGAVVCWRVGKWVEISEGGPRQACAETRMRVSGAGLIS